MRLLNGVDDKKFLRLVDRMMKDFEPNRLSSFTDHELGSMQKSLKLNNSQCQCLLNCLNRLLKQVHSLLLFKLSIKTFKPNGYFYCIKVISDVTKPLVLKNVLSELFSLETKKCESFCECWTANAEQVVTRLQQNLTHLYRVIIYKFYTFCCCVF